MIPIDVIDRGGRLNVRWLDCEWSDFKEPFFQQTVSRKLSRLLANTITEAPVAEIVDGNRRGLPVSPAGYVYHISRCGSTWVSNILRSIPRTFVLSEPTPLIALLDWRGLRNNDEAVCLLRSMIGALIAPAAVEAERTYIKLFSQHIHSLDLIREATPGVPEVFMYRDPIEVLVANLDWPAQGWIWREEFTGLPTHTAVNSSVAELFARGIGKTMLAMIKGYKEETLLINYSNIDTEPVTELATFVGVGPRHEVIERMRESAQWSSKNDLKERFLAYDAETKRRAATRELRELVDAFAGPAYRELEKIRLARSSRPARSR